jgi:DNA-binding LacI/PurR family transcriptional regulator
MDAKRATLRDVAAAAGVSRALAGFVLGDDHGKSIREPTRERVRAAARNLGYVPHGIARALREGWAGGRAPCRAMTSSAAAPSPPTPPPTGRPGPSRA